LITGKQFFGGTKRKNKVVPAEVKPPFAAKGNHTAGYFVGGQIEITPPGFKVADMTSSGQAQWR
jgi:hypothetical protein